MANSEKPSSKGENMTTVTKIITNRWQSLDGWATNILRTDPRVSECETDKGIVFLLDDRDPYSYMSGVWVVDAEPYEGHYYNEVIDALDAKLISQAERKEEGV